MFKTQRSFPELHEVDGFVATIVRTNRRKTMCIRVAEGAVSLIVPMRTSVARIDQLLLTKRQWIKEKIAMQQQMPPVIKKAFVSGEEFLFLGDVCRLNVVKGAYAPAKLLDGCLVVHAPKGDEQPPHLVRNALVRWYKLQAEQLLNEKVTHYATLVGAEPACVNIKTFKARWGSCTIKGKVEFNWLIMLAPHHIIDYVVVHELCHLIHHNHSPRFWQEVARVMPDYAKWRQWLRDNALQLRL